MNWIRLRLVLLSLFVVTVGACWWGDDGDKQVQDVTTVPAATVIPVATGAPSPTPRDSALSTAEPMATSPSSTSAATIEPPADAILLPSVELPSVLTRIQGCSPKPRFSGGGGGGTVPWPTPVGTEGRNDGIDEIELAVFRGVAHRVIDDAANWTNRVALDAESIGSVDDINELGWVLATTVVPLCEAAALAPWPEKYSGQTDLIADLLVDISSLGREMVGADDMGMAAAFLAELRSLAQRAGELNESFDDLELNSLVSGSNLLGLFVSVPAGWHVTSISPGLSLIADYSSQLDLLVEGGGVTGLPSAEVSVRALRNVPDSQESQWINNGELMYPGYVLSDSSFNSQPQLVSELAGARARVEIRATEQKIYYINSVCSINDAVCLEFADTLFDSAELR